MSLYNYFFGFSRACIFFMPILGRKQEQYPRFRDCFLSDDGKYIDIYTRVGGGNRNCGYGEEELYHDPNFVETFDDDYDSTYATYRFDVPEMWKNDFDLVCEHKFDKTSAEYQKLVRDFWSEKMKPLLDKYFNSHEDVMGEKVTE